MRWAGTRRSRIVLVVALMLAAAGPVATALEVVHEDRPGDVSWTFADRTGAPRPLAPVRDAVAPRNGSAADLQAIALDQNRTHVMLEARLGYLPPKPSACGVPPGAGAYCGYEHNVTWTLWHPATSWGPAVRAIWVVACDPDCGETASVQVGDEPRRFDEGPLVGFERVPPDTGRWHIDKRVLQKAGSESGEEDLGPPILCEGDAFFDFRFETTGWEESGVNHYKDDNDPWVHGPESPKQERHDFEPYFIEEDSPDCPRARTAASLVSSGPGVHAPAGIAATVLTAAVPVAGAAYGLFRHDRKPA